LSTDNQADNILLVFQGGYCISAALVKAGKGKILIVEILKNE